jgi:hypothetical protein
MKNAMPTPTAISAEETVPSSESIFGATIWAALAIVSYLKWIHLDLVELPFLLAPWVIVPSALALTPALADGYPIRIFRSQRWLFFVAAALCTASFLRPAGINAALLASCWLAICLCIAWGGLNHLIKFRTQSFPQFCFAIAECYIAVGGVWLVASRAGLHPAGFQEPIVLLTAVHFHFAGFLSSIFAGLTYSTLKLTRWAKPLRIILLGTLLGPGLLGIAFLVSPKLKLIAIILIVIGQCGLAAGMTRIGAANFPGTPISRSAGSNLLSAILLITASISVAAAMIYAATWALGEYPLQPMTDLSHMERIHGAVNSVGFGVIGLLGWIRFSTRNAEVTS